MSPNQYPLSPQDLAQALAQLQADQQKLSTDLTGLQPCSKQQPFAYSVEIPLPQGANARTPGTFTVSQDGPFVALALMAAWRETQGAYAGRWLPPSSVEMYIRSVATFNFANPPRP